MPFQPDQVQVYARMGMGEKLIAQNLYKRFERKVQGVVESYNAQGGAWYSNGGDKVEFGDVPDWVWNEARAMDKGFRQMYRIILPEEKNRGEIMPTFEQAPDWPTAADIMKALTQLDPGADTDWTEDGRPNLMSLKRVLGTYVTRGKLEAIAPNYIRPVVNEDA